MSDDILIQDTTFTAADGYSLAATIFAPQRMPTHAVLINSATAVPRKIYRPFATYLAQRGATVMTYDYRGIGGSAPKSLKGFPCRMRDWAALDVAAAIAHMRQVWPSLPLRYVGHSYGGQALGLAPNSADVSRALFVSAQAGYWGLFTPPENYRVWLLLRLFGRPMTRLIGYAPGWMGFGESLPRDVFLEWTSWVMNRRYFFDDATLDALKNFAKFRGNLRAIGMDDDPWATPPAIDMLVGSFKNATVERAQISPRGAGTAKIGHFGFFRPERRETLWRREADWLLG
jgi:predicted alpha/beta hydrolase